MSSNWSSPTKGLTYTGKVAQSGATQLPGLENRKSPILTLFLRSPLVTGWRKQTLISALDRNILRRRLRPVQAICPSRAAVQSVTQYTFPGGRGGGGVKLGCQVLKGQLRWSREAVPGDSAGAFAGAMEGKVLVTGGAGYIGSHTVLELLEAGYSPVVIDNFHNSIRGEDSMPESLRRVQELTGRSVEFEEMDILDQAALQHLFKKHSFKAVIHFAGLKAVGESVQKPLDYYRVNLTGTIQLLEIMRAHGVKNLVFSSSATVYGNPQYLPLDEAHPTGGCTNPYGKSKFFIEEMIRDLCRADTTWNAVLLRYFNPIGAHASGRIGEDPQGIPNNLMPYVSQVAIGRREALNVFGDDYATEDGTGVRDYIHVVDLAKGHIAALKKLKEQCGCRIYNLGTGTGYSVLQMVQAMEKASGKKIPYKVVARREGDVAACYANPSLAHEELGWTAALGLDRMCKCLQDPEEGGTGSKVWPSLGKP